MRRSADHRLSTVVVRQDAATKDGVLRCKRCHSAFQIAIRKLSPRGNSVGSNVGAHYNERGTNRRARPKGALSHNSRRGDVETRAPMNIIQMPIIAPR